MKIYSRTGSHLQNSAMSMLQELPALGFQKTIFHSPHDGVIKMSYETGVEVVGMRADGGHSYIAVGLYCYRVISYNATHLRTLPGNNISMEAIRQRRAALINITNHDITTPTTYPSRTSHYLFRVGVPVWFCRTYRDRGSILLPVPVPVPRNKWRALRPFLLNF